MIFVRDDSVTQLGEVVYAHDLIAAVVDDFDGNASMFTSENRQRGRPAALLEQTAFEVAQFPCVAFCTSSLRHGHGVRDSGWLLRSRCRRPSGRSVLRRDCRGWGAQRVGLGFRVGFGSCRLLMMILRCPSCVAIAIFLQTRYRAFAITPSMCPLPQTANFDREW